MPDDRGHDRTTISLDAAHALELVDLLAFLADWLADADAPVLDASLQRFVHDAYGSADLHADLTRLAFLLGGDGRQLIHPPQHLTDT